MILETNRLILRQWKDSDRKPFADLNADTETMKYFPKTYSLEESNAFIDKTIQIIEREGIGLLAVELKHSNEFIGFVGLSRPTFDSYFTPCTEIGWRLGQAHWGKGFATEAALEVAKHALDDLKLDEIVSFTSELNIPSIKVMERIGMKNRNNERFDHPRIIEGHPLRPHILYRMVATDLGPGNHLHL